MEKKRKAAGAAIALGMMGTGVALAAMPKAAAAPPSPPPLPPPPEEEVTLSDIYSQLQGVLDRMDIISEKLDELKEKLTITLPEELKTQGKYIYAILAEEVQAKAGQKFHYLFELPIRRFTIFLKVSGATDITLGVSPDSGDHVFNLGTVKSFSSAGDDAILVEHVCNYIEVGTSNAVKITILVAGLT